MRERKRENLMCVAKHILSDAYVKKKKTRRKFRENGNKKMVHADDLILILFYYHFAQFIIRT